MHIYIVIWLYFISIYSVYFYIFYVKKILKIKKNFKNPILYFVTEIAFENRIDNKSNKKQY